METYIYPGSVTITSYPPAKLVATRVGVESVVTPSLSGVCMHRQTSRVTEIGHCCLISIAMASSRWAATSSDCMFLCAWQLLTAIFKECAHDHSVGTNYDKVQVYSFWQIMIDELQSFRP